MEILSNVVDRGLRPGYRVRFESRCAVEPDGCGAAKRCSGASSARRASFWPDRNSTIQNSLAVARSIVKAATYSFFIT
jgi:hypothetical protein